MTDNDLENFKHKLELQVRFMDIDALGHVNNARYLNFLEEARISYSQDVLGLFKKIDEFNILVARIEIDFKSPIMFGEKVSIYTRINSIGTKSFSFESIICLHREEKELIASRAIQTLVTIDKTIGKSIPIPPAIVSAITKYEKSIN